MTGKNELREWLIEALEKNGGDGTVVTVSRLIWEAHEDDLREAGDLFYTWQYDVRWEAQKLRDAGTLVRLDGDKSGVWTLSPE